MGAVSSTMLSSTEREVLEQVPTDLFIAGEWRAASGGGTLAVEDPATAGTLVEVADAQAQDALAALAAAADAQLSGVCTRRASAARSCVVPIKRSSIKPTSSRC